MYFYFWIWDNLYTIWDKQICDTPCFAQRSQLSLSHTYTHTPTYTHTSLDNEASVSTWLSHVTNVYKRARRLASMRDTYQWVTSHMSTRVRDDAYLRPNTKMTYVVSSQNMGRFQAALILIQLIKKKQGKSPKGSFIIPQGIQARQYPPPASFQKLAINYRKLCSRPPPKKRKPGPETRKRRRCSSGAGDASHSSNGLRTVKLDDLARYAK